MTNDTTQSHEPAADDLGPENLGTDDFQNLKTDSDALLDKVDEQIARLSGDLESAKQDVLYAKAETQNVRRRLEKDIADARAYAATSFARDILSVADNMSRALDAIPGDLREDERLKSLVAGIEATVRELDKVFGTHGIARIAAQGMPLDPNQHQAMMEVPSADAEPGTVLQVRQHG